MTADLGPTADLRSFLRTGDHVDLFYLLAVTAASGPTEWLDEGELVKGFVGKSIAATRILPFLLPSPRLLPQTLRPMFESIRQLMGTRGPAEVLQPESKIRAAPDAGRFLQDQWQEFDLPDPALVRLFWALYWGDSHLADRTDIARIQKVEAHLLGSPAAGELERHLTVPEDARQVAARLFEVTIATIRVALHACLPARLGRRGSPRADRPAHRGTRPSGVVPCSSRCWRKSAVRSGGLGTIRTSSVPRCLSCRGSRRVPDSLHDRPGSRRSGAADGREARRHVRGRQTRRTTRRAAGRDDHQGSRLKDLHSQVLTIAPGGQLLRKRRARPRIFC